MFKTIVRDTNKQQSVIVFDKIHDAKIQAEQIFQGKNIVSVCVVTKKGVAKFYKNKNKPENWIM